MCHLLQDVSYTGRLNFSRRSVSWYHQLAEDKDELYERRDIVIVSFCIWDCMVIVTVQSTPFKCPHYFYNTMHSTGISCIRYSFPHLAFKAMFFWKGYLLWITFFFLIRVFLFYFVSCIFVLSLRPCLRVVLRIDHSFRSPCHIKSKRIKK